MSSPPSCGRVRREHTDDNGALDAIAREAEEKLKLKREARAAAREIRMRELEKQEQEESDKKNRHYEMKDNERFKTTGQRKLSSDSVDTVDSMEGRDLKRELKLSEERYLKAMSNLAQVDNDKQTYRFQVNMLREDIDDFRESITECHRLLKGKTKQCHQQTNEVNDLSRQVTYLKNQITLRDQLIQDNGLVLVSDDTLKNCDDSNLDGATITLKSESNGIAALVTPKAREVLGLDGGSLDDRLLAFSQEKLDLQEELKQVRSALEKEREKNSLSEKYHSPHSKHQSNGADVQIMELQLEAQKQLSDYKYRLKKSEADITTLDGNVLRLESQVKRYRSAAESSEKNEDDLKQEKRRLLRELREAQTQIEELTTSNSHLQKRIDKLRSGRTVVH